MSQHTIINSATIEQYYCGIPESSKVSNIPIPLFHVVCFFILAVLKKSELKIYLVWSLCWSGLWYHDR